jgi:hypothetical protein
VEWLRRGGLALAIACALGVTGASSRAGPPRGPDDLRRAEQSYAAMLHFFRTGDRFADTSTEDVNAAPFSAAWPASQAVAAALALAELPDATRAYRGDVVSGVQMLERYWQPGAGGLAGYVSSAVTGSAPPGPLFYDDNEWIALDLVRAYSLTRSRALLARARELFELVASGWGADARVCPGGVYWMRSPANRDRNAVTTENGALLAIQLYELTGGREYLRWARRMVAWSERCLARPDGLLADRVDGDGTRTERAWSYNQGAFIAAAVLLARATGDDRYLDAAARRAAAALARFGTFAAEPRIFAAIFFRDLALLDQARPQPAYRRALARYAREAWATGRDASTGLFIGGGQPTLLDQAAMVQVYALLAGSGMP